MKRVFALLAEEIGEALKEEMNGVNVFRRENRSKERKHIVVPLLSYYDSTYLILDYQGSFDILMELISSKICKNDNLLRDCLLN